MNRTPTTRIDRMEKKKQPTTTIQTVLLQVKYLWLAGWLKYLQPIERDRDRPSSMLDSFIAYQSCLGDCAFTTIYSASAELFEKILQEEIGGKTWTDTKNNNINGEKKTLHIHKMHANKCIYCFGHSVHAPAMCANEC